MALKAPAAVYKIVSAPEWERACQSRFYTGSADDARDGFIHLSTGEQLAETARKHFHGRQGLLLVALATSALGAGLKWEPSRGGALFPHFYGPLDTSIALWVMPLSLDAGGDPIIPEEAK